MKPTLIWGFLRDETQSDVKFMYIAPNVSWASANKTMNPFFDLITSLAANSTANGGALEVVSFTSMLLPSFAEWEIALFANKTGQVGHNVELSSRLISDDLIRNSLEQVADALLSLTYAAV